MVMKEKSKDNISVRLFFTVVSCGFASSGELQFKDGSAELQFMFVTVSYSSFVTVSYSSFVTVRYSSFVMVSYSSFVTVSYCNFVTVSYRKL